MPERIEPGWMDRTTREFDGYPIDPVYLCAERNIESQKAGRFTSDIDYMQLQPEDIAKEGFAVVECTTNKGIYTVPYVITLPDSKRASCKRLPSVTSTCTPTITDTACRRP